MNELKATLSAPEWDIVATALYHRPYGEVANIIGKLQSQFAAQQQQQQQPQPEEEKPGGSD